MHKTVFLFFALITGVALQAQKYSTAAGIRLGSGIGISVQQSVGGNNTVEGIIQKGFLNHYTQVSALFEQHHGVLSRGTNFYLGAGPQIGIYGNSGKTATIKNAFGASFIGGLELKLGKTILSFDYKPSINLSGGTSFLDSQAGFSLRYVLVKAAKREHKWMFWKKKKKKYKSGRRLILWGY